MQFYECHVCGEEFGSDYVGGRQTPKYCPDCKAFPDTGMVAVYGLQTKGGAIRYVGSTMNPVQRLATHRSRTEGGPLSEWMANVGADNVRMAILHVVAADEARRYEEIERLRRKRLLNRRAARQKVFTEEQVRAMLTEFFEKHDGSIDKVL